MPKSLLFDELRVEGIAISITLILAQTIIIAVFIGSIAGFLGGIHHYFELISHFHLQYLIIALICLLLFTVLYTWWWVFITSLIVLLNITLILPYYISQSNVHLKEPYYPIKVLFSNIESRNKNISGFISYVIDENPDILIIQEVTESWINGLQAIEKRFPYNKALPRPWSVGIALYSRLPVAQFEVITLGSERLPGLIARINHGGRMFSVVTMHPRQPLQRHYFRQRNEQLRDAASIVQGLPAPKILVGDLNISLWSPYYAQLIRHTGLYNARQGFGLLPTWPTYMPVRIGMIPIDHCLVSPDIRVLHMRTGWNIGSDHLPIVVDIGIPV